MSAKNLVEFKGIKEGLLLQIDADLEFSEVLLKLKEKIQKSAGFFKGAEIVGIDGRTASKSEKSQLEQLLKEDGSMLVKSLDYYLKTPAKAASKNTLKAEVISDKNDTNDTNDTKPVSKVCVDAVVNETGVFDGLKEGPTQFVRGTMRSGRSVVYKGNVVVLGDVNPGAEIIADGNIVVMGHLRGVAHAGANGNAKAYVCANQLNPTQLRIAKLITRPPEEVSGSDPEIALIKDDMIVIEPYLV